VRTRRGQPHPHGSEQPTRLARNRCPTSPECAGREGNCRAIAVGAGRTLDPDWMKGKPGGWANELLVAYLMPTGHVAAYSVPLVGGAFIWGGKVYR